MLVFKYRFFFLLRQKIMLFWDLIFPLVLGTFFFIAFGNITKSTETFSTIPVAVVAETDNRSYFLDVLEQVSDGEDALISPRYIASEEAEGLLKRGEVDGIYYIDEEISLTVSGDGMNQSILKIISDSYLQSSNTIGNIAQTRPEIVEQVVANINSDTEINHEIKLGTGETDNFVNYYYALIAMTCLYSCFFGFFNVLGIQANMSPLAARRSIAPTKKIVGVLSDFSAAVAVSFLLVSVVLLYLAFVLRIGFGVNWGLVILTSFGGCITGVAYGTLVGAVGGAIGMGENALYGFMTGFTLFLCFLSGLMYGDMKKIIEHNAPVFNRINPAALLSDAFYSLTAFESFTRFSQDIVLLLIISALCCIVSAFILRRKRYASI